MNELQRIAHKLHRETEHLDGLLYGGLDDDKLSLALASSKRVQRDARLLTRLLAAIRDKTATAQEGTSK